MTTTFTLVISLDINGNIIYKQSSKSSVETDIKASFIVNDISQIGNTKIKRDLFHCPGNKRNSFTKYQCGSLLTEH